MHFNKTKIPLIFPNLMKLEMEIVYWIGTLDSLWEPDNASSRDLFAWTLIYNNFFLFTFEKKKHK